jgi:hypothetical protein
MASVIKGNFEVILLILYDVGRSIDLTALEQDLKLSASRGLSPSRDTPASLSLPEALRVPLGSVSFEGAAAKGLPFKSLIISAKAYAEGVVSVETRVEACLPLEQLHTLRGLQFDCDGERHTLDSLAKARFSAWVKTIAPRVHRDQYVFDELESERYLFYCLLDETKGPAEYVKKNRRYLAHLLLGENPQLCLNDHQIEDTLAHSFAFSDRDLAIFDLNRAFIVGPDRDYEDLLLIAEHANFQLLELRTLDKLLDVWLDEAEKDIKSIYTKLNGTPGKKALPIVGSFPINAFGMLSKKLANLQPLRFDALFILENLENSSRIIGDYYLEQIYDHLCGMFNTRGWKRNIERRLEILQNIYSMTKTDLSDRTMMVLELLVAAMIAVELFAFFIPLFQH